MKIRGVERKAFLLKGKKIFSFHDALSPREKDIIQLYKTHLTQAEIAKELGIGVSTLALIIKKLGLKRPVQFKYKGYDKKKIIELTRLGLSEVKIAQKLGVVVSTLRRIKKSYGLLVVSDKNKRSSDKRLNTIKTKKELGLSADCPYKTNILDKHYDQIVGLLQSGVSKTEIAKRYGVCSGTVFNFIHLNGLKAPVIKKCDNKKLIIKLFKQGYSHQRIANELHCSIHTVNDKIQQLGIKRNRNSVKKAVGLNLKEDLIKDLYMQGLAGDEIAEKVHAHPLSVYNKIRKMGLTRPQKWATYRSKQSEFDSQIIELRHLGKTYKEIGNILNIPYTTVSYRFKRMEATNA